jgi:putative endonuclease
MDMKKDGVQVHNFTGRDCVYMLRCGDGSLYTGWTNNFPKRMEAHSSGKGAKYTRGRSPIVPVYLEFCSDKVTATRREAAIKKLTRKKKLALIESERNEIGDWDLELDISSNP